MDPYSDPSAKMPLPGDFIAMFQHPSLTGKVKARWTQLLQERKRDVGAFVGVLSDRKLDRNKNKNPLILYPDFRENMFRFIEQFIVSTNVVAS